VAGALAQGVRQGPAVREPAAEAWVRQRLPVEVAPALLVHAALLDLGGRGVLCCGAPGAGKSTLARLLPDLAVGEELTLVRPGRDGFVAEAIPVRGERGGAAPLALVLELAHGPRHRLERLEGSAAVRSLARHVYWPVDRRDAYAAAFGTVARLAATVPVFRLEFRPEPGVRRVIEEALA